MPKGIIMQSSSVGATPEAIEKVLSENGYETSKPEDKPVEGETKKAGEETEGKETETPAELAEPKREDFETDDDFEAAQEEFEVKQEEIEEQRAAEKEKEEEKKRLAALPKKTRRQKAIEKATRELKEENRKLADRLAALERGGEAKPAAAKPEAKEPELPKAPKREDFKTDAEYDEAMFDYRYQLRRAKEEQENARQRQEETKKQVEARLKRNLENYQSQVAAFREEHDDWDEVVNQPINIHESVYLAVQEQENGAQVTYYLGKHPDYTRRLAEMSPLSAVMEIGRLAEKLKPAAAAEPAASGGTPKKPAPKPIPEPVRPVSTSSTSSTLTSRDAAQKRDYRAFKAAQRKGA